MNYRVHRTLDLPALRKLIPKRFHSQLKGPEFASQSVAALVLDQRSKKIVPAETIRQILESVGNFQEPLRLALVKNLTREGAQLLSDAGFRVLAPVSKKKVGIELTLFPERVRYSRPGADPGWYIKDWETANKLLGFLNPDKNNFAIFDLADGSYIQCLGSKTALTVEARIYEREQLRHWVFGKGAPTGQKVAVGGTAGQVIVDSTQSLQMRDARRIIRQFLMSRSFSREYFAQEVTERFM